MGTVYNNLHAATQGCVFFQGDQHQCNTPLFKNVMPFSAYTQHTKAVKSGTSTCGGQVLMHKKQIRLCLTQVKI